jgi:AraC family transcriptional regulator
VDWIARTKVSTPARQIEFDAPKRPSVYLERSLKGIDVLLHSAPKPPRCGIHTHGKTRMSLLLQGRIVEVDDRGHYEDCGPLSLSVCPAEMPHAHKIHSPSVLTLCWDFAPEFLQEVTGSSNFFADPLVFRRGKVVNVAMRIHREMWARDTASDIVLQGLFIELVGEMTRATSNRPRIGAPSWLKRASELLRERCCDHMTIEEIAAEVGVHPSHLTRTFRSYFGQTPGEYLRRLRLDHASRLVAGSTMSIQEIAMRTGYADHAHFSREFRKSVGMTPLEFRRSVHPI